MLDHATGIVVGETAVIENDVSILQSVTLGGTGKAGGDRHPKIREGVMIGAGAKFSATLKSGAARRLAQVPSFYSRYPRIPLQQAFRHASSASLTAISRPWIWISISTGYIILLSMEMVSDFELSYGRLNLSCARHPHVLRVRSGDCAQSVFNLSAPITLEMNFIKLM